MFGINKRLFICLKLVMDILFSLVLRKYWVQMLGPNEYLTVNTEIIKTRHVNVHTSKNVRYFPYYF